MYFYAGITKLALRSVYIKCPKLHISQSINRCTSLLAIHGTATYDHHGWWKCGYCRSKYLPVHPVQSFRSSLTAPALFYLRASCPNAHAPYLHPCVHKRTAIHGSLRNTVHPVYISAPPSLAPCAIRPPRTVEVQILPGANICPYIHGHASLLAIQGTVTYDHHGWWKCGYCRSKYLPVHPVHKKRPASGPFRFTILEQAKTVTDYFSIYLILPGNHDQIALYHLLTRHHVS